MSGTFDLTDLIWNLILAFMPYFMAGWFVSWKGWYRWIAFAFWILFLPNSFYILTDFVHLSTAPEMIYYDILFITSMAFAGMVSAYASMELVHRYMNIHFHKKTGWIIIMSVVMLSMV